MDMSVAVQADVRDEFLEGLWMRFKRVHRASHPDESRQDERVVAEVRADIGDGHSWLDQCLECRHRLWLVRGRALELTADVTKRVGEKLLARGQDEQFP